MADSQHRKPASTGTFRDSYRDRGHDKRDTVYLTTSFPPIAYSKHQTSDHISVVFTRCTDRSLARPGSKQARKHIRDVRDFNNIETRVVIKFLSLQGMASKEIHVILREILACFLPGRAKDLSAPL